MADRFPSQMAKEEYWWLLCCNSDTETKMLSFWRNFNHWLHWKLSFWQLSVQPVMKISSKWRHFRFSGMSLWKSRYWGCDWYTKHNLPPFVLNQQIYWIFRYNDSIFNSLRIRSIFFPCVTCLNLSNHHTKANFLLEKITKMDDVFKMFMLP